MFLPLEIRSKFHSYRVHLGAGLLDQSGVLLREHPFAQRATSCAVISDETVAALYAQRMQHSLDAAGIRASLFVVQPGEPSKSLSEVGRLANLLANAGLDRHALVVALGGGVVGDLAGFLAAVYYRGIPFVQVPTTIVSQVDSAIGGKTGVNLVAGKNLLGAFYPPSLVLADIDTLGSLPTREFNEGMAEAIKHGVIRDRHLLTRLLALDRRDTPALAAVIHRNLEIKAQIVARDEFERGGERALLNFGHTVGHGVEQASGYGRFLHGEAISLGLVAAARLSVRKAGLPASHYAEIIAALRHFDLPTSLPDDVSTHAVIESIARDKKFEAGDIRFVLTPRLGEAFLSDRGYVTWSDLQRETEDLHRSDEEWLSGLVG